MYMQKSKSIKINAVLNTIKQLCSIIFPLITFPYVSRVLGSDGFGKYSFSNSVVSYFFLLAGLGINTYAIREGAKIRDDTYKIKVLCSELFSINILSMILSYALLVIVVLFNNKINTYSPYIAALSLAILLTTIGTEWINTIFEDFFYITCRYIVIQAISLVLMFTFIRSKDDVIIYCFIAVLASYGGNIINLFYVRKYVKYRFTLKLQLKKHLIPLLVLFANSLAITIYVNSDITMLGLYCADSVVGKYSFAGKINSILKQLINAIVIVAIPRMSYFFVNDKKRYSELLSKLFSAVSALAFPIVVGLFILSQPILILLGGEEYIGADHALRILSIAIITAMYASIVSSCILVIGNKEKECLISTTFTSLTNIGLNFILLPNWGIEGAAFTTIVAETLNFIIQLWYSRRIVHIEIKWKEIVQYVLACIPVAFICTGSMLLIDNILLVVITSVVLSVFAYFICLIIFRNPLVIEAINLVIKQLVRNK